MTLPKQISRVAGQPASVRVGIITSVDPIEVSVGGTVLEDVGFLGSYVPILGESVVVLGQSPSTGTDPASWLALGGSSGTPGAQLLLTKVRQTVAQNMTSSTFTPLLWDVADIDTLGAWSSTLNSTRLTAPQTGWYRLTGGYSFVSNALGSRQAVWFVNSSATMDNFVNQTSTAGLGTRGAARDFHVRLVAGDFVELAVWQNAVTPLATEVGAGLHSSAVMQFLGDNV